MSSRWWTAGFVLVLGVFAQFAHAGDFASIRVQDALDATDRRIETAAGRLAESPAAPAQAESELTTARDLQSRARGAFTAGQLLLARTLTLEARTHADRVLSILIGTPDPDHVTAQVERTRDIVDRARDRLQACDDLRARAMLRVSMDMQDRAESRLDASKYLAALQLTMSARERVQKAMQLCNVSESLSDAADRAIQRTNDVLARGRDHLDAEAPAEARELLGRAQSIQAQAQSEAALSHWESALRMTQDARMTAMRAIRGARARRAAH